MSKHSRTLAASRFKATSTKLRASASSRTRSQRRRQMQAPVVSPPLLSQGKNADLVELPPVEPLRIKLGGHTIGGSTSHLAPQYMTVIKPATLPKDTKLIPAAYLYDTCAPPKFEYDPDNPPRTCYGLLPYDVLYEIFVQCLSPDLSRRTQRGEAPLVLCQVCRHWRRTALSLSILWNEFSAVKRSSGKHLFHQKMLHLFLERSRARPLTFKISPPAENRFMEVIMTQVQRWKEVGIIFGNSRTFAELFLSVSHTPMLESLMIDTVLCKNYDIVECIPWALMNMTQLRKLAWKSKRVPSSMMNIPFFQLVHLDLWCPIRLEDCLAIVRCCCRIATLRIDVKAPSARCAVSEIISIPTLTHLDVVPYCELADFLAHFHLPGLRFIRVMHRRSFLHNFLGLEEFCVRSGCTLETFRLNDRRQPSQEVIQYLSLPCLQSVRELHIFADGIEDSFVKALMVPIGSPWSSFGHLLLPRLKKLVLGRCTTTDGAVAEMVESRCRSAEGIAAGTQLEMVRALYRKGKNKEHTYHPIDILGFKASHKSEVRISWGWK